MISKNTSAAIDDLLATALRMDSQLKISKADQRRLQAKITTAYLYAARHIKTQKPQATKSGWRKDGATRKQIDFIRTLGVNLTDERASKMNKGLASDLISAAKSGDGVGYLGFEFTDGSL